MNYQERQNPWQCWRLEGESVNYKEQRQDIWQCWKLEERV